MLSIIPTTELVKYSKYDKHSCMYRISDATTNLRGFLAIHNTNLGPAVGGTRIFLYPNEKAAVTDVLRLSRAMTYKCALAGVSYGGGKVVIIAEPSTDKTPNLLKAYAECIKELDHKFYTGEDVGLSEADVQYMLKFAPNFIGKSELAGDPSPYASLSTYYAMQAAVKVIYNQVDLKGRKVAIKGVGKVGSELARLLVADGAEVYVSDISEEAVHKIATRLPDVHVVDNSSIEKINVDIFAPCALGDDITKENVQEIKAKIICGTANNQLADNAVGDKLYELGKFFVVDYVANCGGLINVVDELEEGGYRTDRVMQRITKVRNTVEMLYWMSRSKNLPTNRVADTLGEEIIKGRISH